MSLNETYLQRLWKVAQRETRGIWTSYRWWLAFAPAIGAILLDFARNGWRAVTATELALNALGGATIAFLGSVLISICRAPKLLDDERVAQLTQQQGALEIARNETQLVNAAVEALRRELAAEREKDRLPEIAGLLTNFRYAGRRPNGDFTIDCDALLCNIRPARTNLRRIVIDASEVQPPLVISCSTPDVILEQGIAQKIEVQATLILESVTDPHDTMEIVLAALKVSALDGFGNQHTLRVDPGAMLFVDPDEPFAPTP